MKASLWKLFIFFIILFSRGVRAQCPTPPSNYLYFPIKIKKTKKEITLKIHFPQKLEESKKYLKNQVLNGVRRAEERLGLELQESTDVIFDHCPLEHNGLATILPKNRIYIYTEAPRIESSVGFYKNYILETITHEMGHMIYLQQRGGVFSFFDVFVGNSSRPLGSWPRWIHEGIAVDTETIDGGRVNSGYLNFEKRQYAEYFKRKKHHPIRYENLQGSGSHSSVRPGHIPYHFGYSLIENWKKSNNQSNLSKLIKASSRSLGISFRKHFSSNEKSIDQIFKETQVQWAETPVEKIKKNLIVSENHIEGPFNGETLNWIESQDSEKHRSIATIERSDQDGKWILSKTPLKENYLRTEKIVHFKGEKSLRLIRKWPQNSNENATKEIQLFSDNNYQCSLPLPLDQKIRDFAANTSALFWIVSDAEGSHVLRTATFSFDCQVLNEKILVKTEPFQRLSSINALGERWALSANNGYSAYREKIIADSFEVYSPEAALSNPQWVNRKYCDLLGHDTCLFALAHSEKFWQPIFIGIRDGKISSKLLPVDTGAQKIAWQEKYNHLVVLMKYWDHDEVLAFNVDQFTEKGIALEYRVRESSLSLAQKEDPAKSAIREVPADRYSAWPSIWPHFWLPSAAASGDSFVFIGQTFYSDNYNYWSGATLLGYDAYVKRPLAFTQLSRSSIRFLGISSVMISAHYTPNISLGSIQDRWAYGVHFKNRHRFFDHLKFSWRIGLHSENASEPIPFSLFVPSITLSFSSPYGSNPISSNFKLSNIRAGYYLLTQFKKYESFYNYNSLALHGSLRKLGFATSLEYGQMDEQNFPAAYFVWGGQDIVSTRPSRFYTRGFSPRLSASSKIVRVAQEIGFKWGSGNWGLSWDRANIKEVHQKFIFETVSSDILGSSTYKIGNQFFTSVGSELEFWGTLLFYVDFKASLGFYKGFGDLGENRVLFNLRSFLDI